ncbi:hypothetical protein EE612_002026, partial [Oryza sativa]
FMVQAIS